MGRPLIQNAFISLTIDYRIINIIVDVFEGNFKNLDFNGWLDASIQLIQFNY